MTQAHGASQNTGAKGNPNPCFNGIDLDTPFHWMSEEVAQPSKFFERLHTLLDPDAILYFEGTTIAPEIAAFYETHQSERRVAIVRESRLRPGDLAVTADGVHVLAYLGERTWIEADPNLHKTTEVTLPTSNAWFQVPVVIVRCEFLSKPDEISVP